ncbi:Hypothetical predicted protein [Mytilus galloprovincialis]|uniref:Uncharacterized protein n=1 Tax=Mytilus galloprovincialis TaxID=29158 RepID=A0A8B6F2C1_MYTGA|nr:Hypothetical predicted protein [Mytilus galloprovincialis]
MSNWDLEIEAAASEGDKMDETVIAKPGESLQLEDLKKEKRKKRKRNRHSQKLDIHYFKFLKKIFRVSRISKRDNVNSGNKHVTNEKEVKPEFEQTPKEENNNKQLNSELGSDMWKQLKRVSIPILKGDKRNYQSWKAAFLACIDQAPAAKEYKLLQLRQYVEVVIQVIENLRNSAVAYAAAKERLERKYVGQRRQITLYIEELENIKPMREGIAKDIEHFADLLDIAVVNLKEAGRFDELKNQWFFVQQNAEKDDRIYVIEVPSLDIRKRKNRVS